MFCFLTTILIQAFSFVSTCDKQGLVGDLNDDGIVNSIDATILKRFLLEVIDSLPVENPPVVCRFGRG